MKQNTVDREIFAVKKFSPVAQAANGVKIKRVYISYTKNTVVAKINCVNISYVKKKLRENFPIYGSYSTEVRFKALIWLVGLGFIRVGLGLI